MRRWNIGFYLLAGTLWLVFGAAAVGGFLASDRPAEEIHLTREAGAGAVLAGLLHLWCAAHYERRLGVHAMLMVFAALFAGIHWHDWMAGARGIVSPLLNSVPLLLLAATLRGSRATPPPAPAGTVAR